MFWKIPEIWPRSTVYVLGGGPTLVDSLEKINLRNKHVLGVNSAFSLGLWVDVLFFGDAKFYWWNRNGIDNFSGLKISTDDRSKNRYCSIGNRHGINVVKKGRLHGLENKPDRIGWNRSSGAASINVAYHLGARRIILLGFDMRLVDGKKNWKPHSRENTKKNPFQNFIKGFIAIKRDAKRLELEILNATPDSALKIFPMMDLCKGS